MHFIDQELSSKTQLGAIVGAISGYLCPVVNNLDSAVWQWTARQSVVSKNAFQMGD